MILNIMFLSLLIGYSLAVTSSARAVLKMRKEVARVEDEESIPRDSIPASKAVLPDPDNTSPFVAVTSFMILVIVVILFMQDPELVLSGDMKSGLIAGATGFLFLVLIWAFYSIAAGSYDLAILSDHGIIIRNLATGVESSIPWNGIEHFSFYLGEAGVLASFILKAGEHSLFVKPTKEERERVILMLAVRNVPRRLWQKDIELHLRDQFGITVDDAGASPGR